MAMERFTRLCTAGSVCFLVLTLVQSAVSAQSDIPEVLTPSLETPPEPSIYIPMEASTAAPTAVSAANVTAPVTQQSGISLERLISGIPLLTVVLLVPILIVIAALFYALLKTDQEGERSP